MNAGQLLIGSYGVCGALLLTVLFFWPRVERLWDAWRESWSLRKIPRHGGRPYLERRGREQTVEDAHLDRERGTWRARLHHFVGPDDAGHHNHPFKWSLSIVFSALWGASYTEEVLTVCEWHEVWPKKNELWPEFDHCLGGKCKIETRRVRFFNWIPNGKYHRITELHPGLFGVWTLFITGPRVTSWGFWVPGRGHVHHKIYNKEQGNERQSQDVE